MIKEFNVFLGKVADNFVLIALFLVLSFLCWFLGVYTSPVISFSKENVVSLFASLTVSFITAATVVASFENREKEYREGFIERVVSEIWELVEKLDLAKRNIISFRISRESTIKNMKDKAEREDEIDHLVDRYNQQFFKTLDSVADAKLQSEKVGESIDTLGAVSEGKDDIFLAACNRSCDEIEKAGKHFDNAMICIGDRDNREKLMSFNVAIFDDLDKEVRSFSRFSRMLELKGIGLRSRYARIKLLGGLAFFSISFVLLGLVTSPWVKSAITILKIK